MIKKSNKKTVFNILNDNNLTEIRFIFKASLLGSNQLINLGFLQIKENEHVIPRSDINAFFKSNANDKYKVKKDLPKIKKEIEYETEITDWHGNLHSVSVYRQLLVYQKDTISALNKELYLIKINNEMYVATEKIDIKEEYNIKYNLDLILNAYPEIEIINNETNNILQKIKKMTWEILPTGENPWEKLEEFIDNQNINETFTNIENNPKLWAHKIISYNPNFIAIGKMSFNNYIVYSFDNLSILESYKKNNATYIFKENWENLSKLTKKELLSSKYNLYRIIHKNNWNKEIELLFH